MKNLLEYWEHCHTEEIPKEITKRKLISREDRAQLINNLDIKVTKSTAQINDLPYKNLLIELEESNKSSNSFCEYVNNSFSDDGLEIKSPISNKLIKSNCSFSSQIVSFIRFFDNKEVFYLVQTHQAFGGLFFPMRKLYIPLSGGNAQGYIDFIINIIFNKNELYVKKIKHREKRECFFLASCPRPWHYYYNLISGSILLDQKKIPMTGLAYVRGGDFLNLKKIFEEKKIISFNGATPLLESNHFFFSSGISFNALTQEDHDLVRKKVLNTVKNYNPKKESTLDTESKTSINIWIGITSQKRRWLEEVDGIALALKEISRRFEKVTIYIDGWTSPLTPSENDKKQITSDNEIFKELKIKAPSTIRYINIIGATSEEKISAALNCDFYISNYSSGSIHVSRFAGIPGISHLNNNMPREHHIHYNNVEVSNRLVKDAIENGKTGHHVSYSIAPRDFLSEFNRFFNNLRIKDISALRL